VDGTCKSIGCCSIGSMPMRSRSKRDWCANTLPRRRLRSTRARRRLHRPGTGAKCAVSVAARRSSGAGRPGRHPGGRRRSKCAPIQLAASQIGQGIVDLVRHAGRTTGAGAVGDRTRCEIGDQLIAINRDITAGKPDDQTVEDAAQCNPDLPALQAAANVGTTVPAVEGSPLALRAAAEALQPGTNTGALLGHLAEGTRAGRQAAQAAPRLAATVGGAADGGAASYAPTPEQASTEERGEGDPQWLNPSVNVGV
jgi:hypothetical protein